MDQVVYNIKEKIIRKRFRRFNRLADLKGQIPKNEGSEKKNKEGQERGERIT